MPRHQPTFSEIRTEVRRYLDDANGGIWLDAEVNRNINRAILRTWLDTEWETKTSTIEGVTNNAWYYLPADCLVPKLLLATDWNQEKIFPTDLILMDKFDTGWEGEPNSIPSRFIPFSYDRFIIWPPINANSGNRTLTMQFTPIPTEVTQDSDAALGSSATVPPLFISELIPLKATALCWLRVSWQKAQEYNGLYNSELQNAQVTLRNLAGAATTKFRPAGKFERAHGSPRFKLRL